MTDTKTLVDRLREVSSPFNQTVADRLEELERENAAMRAKLAFVRRLVEIADQVNATRTEQEVATSASFEEAVAYTQIETLESENAALKERIKELENNNYDKRTS